VAGVFGATAVGGGLEHGCAGVDMNIGDPLEYGNTHTIGEETERVGKLVRDVSGNGDEVVGAVAIGSERIPFEICNTTPVRKQDNGDEELRMYLGRREGR
jgi:hypothetical protein